MEPTASFEKNIEVFPFELPRNLSRSVADSDTSGSERQAWMAALPLVVDDLARRWRLDLGRPFQPGGVASWVAPAHTEAGDLVVLKVGWCHDEALHEADGLRVWDGQGTVRIYDSVVVDTTSALLLEACEPGSALSQCMPPQEQDAVVAGLLRRLWIEPPTGHPFRTLQSMCDWWADEFEEKYAAVGSGVQLDPGLGRAGIELFRSLPGTAERTVLLCTDLHSGNILAAGREPWLAIDPKPYVGDPTYDPLQHMLNFPGRLLEDPVGFVQRMANLLDLDPGRLQLWLYARSVRESVDRPGLRDVLIELAP